MTEKSAFIAVAQIEYAEGGERKYAQPGSVVRLTEADAKSLKKIKAIRELNDQEKELEELRAGSAAKAKSEAKPKSGKAKSDDKADDKADEDI